MGIQQSNEVMRAERVAFTYFGESKLALHSCSFCIQSGSVVLVAGGNGSGKTTLLKLMAGTMQSHEGQLQGEITYGMHQDGTAPMMGFILQEAKEQFVIGIVEDELAFAPENLGLPRKVIVNRVEEQLERADLRDLRLRQVQQLSGGEQQRTAVASVLTMEPDVLLIDDAWSQMDKESRNRLSEQLQAWHGQGRTIILAVSRLDELAAEWQHGWIREAHLLLLHNGRMVYDGKMPAYPTGTGLNDQPRMKDDLRILKLCREAGIVPPQWGRSATTLDITIQAPCGIQKDEGEHFCHDRKIETYHRAACEDKVVLSVSNLNYCYHRNADQNGKDSGTNALHKVSFQLKAGQCMLLTGVNGSGKSTLFRILTGSLLTRSGRIEGKIQIVGKAVSKLRTYELARLIGFAAQQPESGFFAASVQEELQDALLTANQCGQLQIEEEMMEGQAVYAYEQVEREVEYRLRQYHLWDVKHVHPHDMPAGLKRLLSLAIASAHEPGIIMLDEPTASLDAAHAAFVRDWCLSQAERGRALLVATHDGIWQDVNHPRLVHAKMDRGSLHIDV